MLLDTIKGNIIIKDKVQSWEEAIQISAEPLLKKNWITEGYVDTMISNVKKNGPYIVIVPGFAMPHARPECGALQTGMSFLKLNEPVVFPDDMEVQLILSLAANDSNAHLAALSELTDIVMDDDKMEQLFHSETIEEILEILK